MVQTYVGIYTHYIECFRRIFGEGNGTPLQYSCLENPMGRGAWEAAVHGVAKSRTRLSDFTFTFHFPALEKEMATHFSALAWRIPGMGEPGGLPSMRLHRVRHDWSDLAAVAAEGYLITEECAHDMVSKKGRLQGYCTTTSIYFFFFKKNVCMGEFSFLLYFLCWICNLQPDYIPHKCQWINFLVPQCRELAPLLVYSCVYMPLTSLPWASFGRSHGKEARDCRRRQESTGLFLAQSWVSFVAWGNFVTFLHIPEPWFPHLKKGIGGHSPLSSRYTHS